MAPPNIEFAFPDMKLIILDAFFFASSIAGAASALSFAAFCAAIFCTSDIFIMGSSTKLAEASFEFWRGGAAAALFGALFGAGAAADAG